MPAGAKRLGIDEEIRRLLDPHYGQNRHVSPKWSKRWVDAL